MSRQRKRRLRLVGGGALWAAGMLVGLSAVLQGAAELLPQMHLV
ncbi:MAG TPA: hypothetical protein VFK82_08145 [Burkholderiaceae bacterium]|nr:hypothetical protein [Burkholderiaceae bacterium]